MRVISVLGGWGTVLAGLALLPLPGPGSLLVVLGLRMLVPYSAPAARLYEPAERRALAAARAGVATWPRLVLASAGPGWLVILAVTYARDTTIPVVALAGLQLGPSLPFGGLAMTVGLWASAAATTVALIVSGIRWGPLSSAVTTSVSTSGSDEQGAADPAATARRTRGPGRRGLGPARVPSVVLAAPRHLATFVAAPRLGSPVALVVVVASLCLLAGVSLVGTPGVPPSGPGHGGGGA